MSLKHDSGWPLKRSITYLGAVKLEGRLVRVDGAPQLEGLAKALRVWEVEVDEDLWGT